MMELKGLRVNLILEQIRHHAKRTSPDWIYNYISYQDLIPRGYKPFKIVIPKFIANYFIRKSGMRCYTYESFLTESFVLFKLLFSEKGIYHFNNGNDMYRYSHVLKSKKTKIIATFHQPPELMHRFITDTNHLRKLDAVLVVGSNQIPYFEKFLPSERIFKFSLATDTSFFIPGEQEPKSKVCLFVGQWLRDFNTLRGVIEYINKKDRSIKFRIITFRDNWPIFRGLQNIELLSDLTDEQLRDEYMKAKVFLLPLLGCTGNCALLEAMSAGLPIITNDIGGIRDYIDQDCAILCNKGDVESMANGVLELFSDKKKIERMGIASRNKATSDFEWQVVSEKLADIYRAVSEF